MGAVCPQLAVAALMAVTFQIIHSIGHMWHAAASKSGCGKFPSDSCSLHISVYNCGKCKVTMHQMAEHSCYHSYEPEQSLAMTFRRIST